MLNFNFMEKKPDRYHIYEACHADLILGGGVAVSYVQVGKRIAVQAKYMDSATINLLDLNALDLGLNYCSTEDSPFTIYTNSKYISTVLSHIGSWRNQNILEQKAHPEMLTAILSKLDTMGDGLINVSPKQNGRDDVMMHCIKYTKHLYHKAQLEMIRLRTNVLPQNLFETTIWEIDELAGSILWKSPLSVDQFQKKMTKARLENDSEIHVELKQPMLKLVK